MGSFIKIIDFFLNIRKTWTSGIGVTLTASILYWAPQIYEFWIAHLGDDPTINELQTIKDIAYIVGTIATVITTYLAKNKPKPGTVEAAAEEAKANAKATGTDPHEQLANVAAEKAGLPPPLPSIKPAAPVNPGGHR